MPPMIRIALATIAMAALAGCGDPDLARKMDACVSRGAELLAGVDPSPRETATTRCSQSVDAFGVIP